ncbi:hypothetical protein NLJ89_g2745 [Agrocybe chaxingu]|uniref:Uncharacterized protein n=1 Tax=Agrocybe chaxingu TaxID=84603 RepID=A0A9W8K6X4_9AGAR|nr:hypothetical protein NLJ89_g2745 [Agrocybe chaxingu]
MQSEVNPTSSPLQVLAEVCSNASPVSSPFNTGAELPNEDRNYNGPIEPWMPTPVEETNDCPPLLLPTRAKGNPMDISNFLDGPPGRPEISGRYSGSPRWNARSSPFGISVGLHGTVGEVAATGHRHPEPYPSSSAERQERRAARRVISLRSPVRHIPASVIASGATDGAQSLTSTPSRRYQPSRTATFQTEDSQVVGTVLPLGGMPGNKNPSSPSYNGSSFPGKAGGQSRKQSQSTMNKPGPKKKSVTMSSKQQVLGPSSPKATRVNTRVKGRRNLTPQRRKDFAYNPKSLMMLSRIDPTIAGCIGCRRRFQLDGRQALKNGATGENHYIGFILKHIPICPEIPLESKILVFLDYQALTNSVLSKKNESALSK